MGKQIRDTICGLKNLVEDIKCIVGMSFDKKKAEEKIEGLGGPVREHFIKLLFYGDIERKWKNDIAIWLFKIQEVSIKPKLKLFNKKQYYRMLYADPMENRSARNFKRELDILEMSVKAPPRFTVQDIERNYNSWNDIFEKMYFKISELLSKDEMEKEEAIKIINQFIKDTK